MAEHEIDVRALLRVAVPPDLEAEPYRVIDGAAAYARRARAGRVTASALAAVLVAALVATVAWVGFQRPRPVPVRPAPNPVTRELCRNPHPTSPPARPATGLSGDAAAICATGADGGPGWVLPGAPLTLQRWITYLRQGVASTPSHACSAGPAGPPFLVVIKRVNGPLLSYRGSQLACGGREAVARYLAALAYERADVDAAAVVGNAVECSPPQDSVALPLSAPTRVELRTAHTSAMLCAYPVYDPSSRARLVPRDYRAITLSPNALAVLNADLATATFSTHPPATCAPSTHQLALRTWDPDAQNGPGHEHIEFVSTCLDVLRLTDHAIWWQPNATTLRILTALLGRN